MRFHIRSKRVRTVRLRHETPVRHNRRHTKKTMKNADEAILRGSAQDRIASYHALQRCCRHRHNAWLNSIRRANDAAPSRQTVTGTGAKAGAKRPLRASDRQKHHEWKSVSTGMLGLLRGQQTGCWGRYAIIARDSMPPVPEQAIPLNVTAAWGSRHAERHASPSVGQHEMLIWRI